jgi:putative flippase GtrA
VIDAQTLRQTRRYAISGLTSNLALYLLYLGLTGMSLGHKTSMTLAFVVGVLVSFFLNRKWSFNHKGCARLAFFRFSVAYALGYLINLGILMYGVDNLNYPHQLIQAISILIVAGFLFIALKFWVFSQSDFGALK